MMFFTFSKTVFLNLSWTNMQRKKNIQASKTMLADILECNTMPQLIFSGLLNSQKKILV